MKKTILLVLSVLMMVLFCCACGDSETGITQLSELPSGQHAEQTTNDNFDPSVNYAEKLLSCSFDEISAVELTNSNCNDGKIMCKTLTSDEDINRFIDILKKVNLKSEPLSVPNGVVWGYAVRVLFKNGDIIWVHRNNTADNYVNALLIGNSVYEIETDEFDGLIGELYDTVDQKETEWSVE
ncbi:MAG: hypothetical protein NC122_08140 [Faecalibacterium sp.]|nr:hypothetical protein [Ruminococcus sp.]MCM1392924.1 hypothetical protein [Ruminococcus sp.]MCM1486164.1 hypothetical protein [Faecalibacterium sp.]